MNILRIDPIKVSVARLESKRAAFAHLHTPHMDTRWLEFGWHDRPHPVACLEAAYLLLPHLIPTREPFLRPVGSAMVASAARLDRQRFERAGPDARHIPDA